jgi:NADH-quinone oxidoreductase subunit F
LDLHLSAALPTEEERLAVDAALGTAPSSWTGGVRDIDVDGRTAASGHAARAERHRLLPALHAVHARAGWISPGALNYVSQRLDVPPAETYGVASFYGMFSMTPRPARVIHVCDDIACLTRGAGAICEELERKLGPPGSTWLRSPCLGMCERAPAALFAEAGEHPRDEALVPATADAICQVAQSGAIPLGDPANSVPQAGQPQLRLLKRIGKVDPHSLADYRAHGGYEALRKAVDMGPAAVIREVIASKLVGRGGAAFPAGKKWEALYNSRANGRTHYLVCNADESEPGTFKDRVIMESDPFALIESMTIAGFAIGAERGFLYIRGEYPLATERLTHAINEARAHGLLGADVHFDIELRRGAGAYICGEETALFNSIEGYRGEPRNKPPYPTEAGLFGEPTVVNNVETLINVPGIVLDGGAAYAAIGTERSTGTKLFCLSGHIARPGVYEAAFGATLRELIDLAGGVAGSGRLQAVLLGGAAGAFVTPAELDTPLTFEGTRAIGASLGSAVVMLFDDTIDLRKILLRIAAFFRDESCGQCVPCRVGTVRQEELMHRLAGNHALGSVTQEVAVLHEIGQVMRDASICGLGHTASSAIDSALKRWSMFHE